MSPDALLQENKRLQNALATRNAALIDSDTRVAILEGKLAALEARFEQLVAGRSANHTLAEGQGVLFPAEVLPEDDTPAHANEAPDGETPDDKIKRRCRPKSPAQKTDHSALPVKTVLHELPENERICPDTSIPLVPIGTRVTTVIEYKRAQMYRVEHTQVIYGLGPEHAEDRQAEERVAPLPKMPLKGCAASANLLAWILVQKYANHLPLYRQESIFKRDGLRLPRQTMCDWVMRAADLLRPIADSLMRRVKSGEIMQLDDTPVTCQGAKGQGNFQAYLWTFINPKVDGVVYQFTANRKSDSLKDEIEGFEGYLVGDGYSGNKAAARKVKGDIVIAGCWAHTIRKFRDALEEAPGTAELFRKDIKALYLIEDEATEIDAEDDEATNAKVKEARRLALRQKKSRPILARLLVRARKVRGEFSDAGKMGEALGYLLRQRKPLRRYLEHGGLPIDNNACERSIRPIAVGRRNWLFAGSVRGGEAAAVIYTLIECCRLADVDMLDYLADAMERVKDHPREKLNELEPVTWAKLFAEKREGNVLKADAVLGA